MNINIISLVNSPRRKIAQSRAKQAGLTPIFFDAIDGSSIQDRNQLMYQSSNLFESRYSRKQSLVELATLLSHRTLYKTLLDSPCKYHLIAEDDFIPIGDLNIIDEVIDNMRMHDFDVTILGYPRCDDLEESKINQANPIYFPIKLNSNSELLMGKRCIETTCGCLSYLISTDFIDKVLRINTLAYLADDWNLYSKSGIKIAHLSACIFREDFKGLPSTMDPTRSLVLRDSWPKRYISLMTPEFVKNVMRKVLGRCRLFIARLTDSRD